MSLFDAFRYDGKRALVVGGATGIGAAVAELVGDAGAHVIVMDRADPEGSGAEFVRLDLADKASIEAAAGAVAGPIHAVFSCAGVADGTPGIEKVNFIGHRHLIEQLLAADKLPRGSAIGMISSAAGMGWQPELETLTEFLDIADFDAASQWAIDTGRAHYMFTKQAVNAYVAREAMTFLKRGIRINAIMPGPTNTPLARANADLWLTFAQDYREEVGIEASTPMEQAYPLVFLCSDAGVGVNGATILSDAGYASSGTTGSFPPATAIVDMLSGRT